MCLTRAIIICADSDMVPAVRRVRNRLPGKQIFIATPPGRFSHARELRNVSHSSVEITAGRIGKWLLPKEIKDAAGNVVATRPKEYDPLA
jgi:hypothetical protein